MSTNIHTQMSYIIRLCANCGHDHGCVFTCPDCGHSDKLWYVRECGSRISCFGCKKWWPGPVIDECNHKDDEEEPDDDHECRYHIEKGMSIEVVNPETEEVVRAYTLDEPLEFLSQYAITDYLYNKGYLTVCQECRHIPDGRVRNGPFAHQFDRLETYVDREEHLEKVIKRYYEALPSLEKILPQATRMGKGEGISIDDWVVQVRISGCRAIAKNKASVLANDIAIERRLYNQLFKSITP